MVAQAIGEGISAAWEARYTWCDTEISEGMISLARNIASVAAVVFTFFALAGVPPGMAPSVAHTSKLAMAWMTSATFNWNPAVLAIGVAAITDFVCHMLEAKSSSEQDAARIARLEQREVELLHANHHLVAENNSLVDDNRRLATAIEDGGFRIDSEKVAASVGERLDGQFNVIIKLVHRLAGVAGSRHTTDASVSHAAQRRDCTMPFPSGSGLSVAEQLRSLARNIPDDVMSCCAATRQTRARTPDRVAADTASEGSHESETFEVVGGTPERPHGDT